MKAALLPDRGVVKVSGDGARSFLHGIVTADLVNLPAGAARFCALLTPQGKIIADFFAVEASGGILFDLPKALAATVVARLNLYKLRAKVAIEDVSGVRGVLAAWSETGARSATTARGVCYADPRLPALGLRVVIPPELAAEAAADLGAVMVDAAQYETHRIALGVPQGGVDFSYGDAFPHEADMDQLDGIDFKKGCYVGQEVVSRIEHRGLARTRAVQVGYEGSAPRPGVTIEAGGRALGTMGSAAAGRGVALIRLDRAADALAQGATLTAGGVPIRLIKPAWARFAFPGESEAAL